MVHVTTRFVRRFLLVAAVLAAVGLGVGIGITRAADPRLDEADAALQKADALLEASQTGGVSDRAQKRFDRAIARAGGHRGRARPDRRREGRRRPLTVLARRSEI